MNANERLSFSEDEILKMAEKIQQNRQEDKLFESQIERFFDNNQKMLNQPIEIGATPNALVIAGANSELPLTINPQTILKCVETPDKIYHGHELSKKDLKNIVTELRDPVLILKGSHENSLVAVTKLKDDKNREIIVAVELESRQNRHTVNRITSAYGRNNFRDYIDKQLNEKHNIIAYNIEKANEMFQSLGLQSPPEETFISFDNSISYTTANVKYPEAESLCQVVLGKNKNQKIKLSVIWSKTSRERLYR